jgi:hypothetical protein
MKTTHHGFDARIAMRTVAHLLLALCIGLAAGFLLMRLDLTFNVRAFAIGLCLFLVCADKDVSPRAHTVYSIVIMGTFGLLAPLSGIFSTGNWHEIVRWMVPVVSSATLQKELSQGNAFVSMMAALDAAAVAYLFYMTICTYYKSLKQ